DGVSPTRFHAQPYSGTGRLEAFVPEGASLDPELQEVIGRTGFSRWFPVDGGHRLLALYEGGAYNHERFSLVKGGWDHEHWNRCSATIPPMTRCWVTRADPFVLLDEACYRELFGQAGESPE